jgi:hypothetical protein
MCKALGSIPTTTYTKRKFREFLDLKDMMGSQLSELIDTNYERTKTGILSPNLGRSLRKLAFDHLKASHFG